MHIYIYVYIYMYIGNKQNIAIKLKVLCSLQFLKNTKFVRIVLNPL